MTSTAHTDNIINILVVMHEEKTEVCANILCQSEAIKLHECYSSLNFCESIIVNKNIKNNKLESFCHTKIVTLPHKYQKNNENK